MLGRSQRLYKGVITLALPVRHCIHATAIACRRFLLSGGARCWPGSSEAGAMGCHRSEGSMLGRLGVARGGRGRRGVSSGARVAARGRGVRTQPVSARRVEVLAQEDGL